MPNWTPGAPCRGYPCGKEEIGAANLWNCRLQKGWIRTCGYRADPPANIAADDVLIYHPSLSSRRRLSQKVVDGTLRF